MLHWFLLPLRTEMPCYQSTNLPSGFPTTGRTSYTTEAECLQACKEGACCEGTSCTVKPACQCQCTSGSCCGPDTYTNVTNETGPRCRTESQADCAARGGTWRCGVPCRGLAYDPAAGYGLGSNICSSLDATPSTTPVFKGVGAVCATGTCLCCDSNGTPKQGSGCQQCWCFCGEGAAAYPRFINVTLSGTYQMFRPKYIAVQNGFQENGREYKDKSFSCSVTLSAISTPSRSNCPGWTYGTGSANLPLGSNGAVGYVLIDYPTFPSTTSAHFGVRIVVSDLSEFSVYQDWRTSGAYILGSQLPIMSSGIQTSGTCFSDIAVSFTASPNGVPNDTATFAIANGSITGVQA
jgi:hypothetical protein